MRACAAWQGKRLVAASRVVPSSWLAMQLAHMAPICCCPKAARRAHMAPMCCPKAVRRARPRDARHVLAESRRVELACPTLPTWLLSPEVVPGRVHVLGS